MKRPLHHTNHCTDCDGLGRTRDEDYDEHGSRIIMVRCEACDGSGLLTDCDRCGEVISLPEAEQGSYVCTACRVGLEQGDAEAEIARIRRWSAA